MNNFKASGITIESIRDAMAKFEALPKPEHFELWVRRDLFKAMESKFPGVVEIDRPGIALWHGIRVLACLPDESPIAWFKMPCGSTRVPPLSAFTRTDDLSRSHRP